jgi:Fe-S-cluster containining protein
LKGSDPVKQALDQLTKKWKVPPEVYDLHLGKRGDVLDNQTEVNGVIYHIPYLSTAGLYVLWKCLWPECHNCCDRQGRLPLSRGDIDTIAKKLGYKSKSEFVSNETVISSWQEQESLGSIITTISMISLKRKADEREQEDGTPLPCRFLDGKGSCTLHPDKPGVCWLYPFASWTESDSRGRPKVHASFQLTGDCPGFYLDNSVESMMPVLQEYSKKIYNYNMEISRTVREKYGFINFVDLDSKAR